MAKLYNRVRVNTSTAGTGTVTLGSAFSNSFCTFAEAGVANADVVAYVIEEGNDFEIGIGTYTSAGTTLSRDTVTLSKISGASGTTKMTLAGAATVRITARKEDIFNVADPLTSAQVAVQADQETATSTTLAVTPGRQQYHPSAAKFWIRWGINTSIAASYNVTSVTDTGAGDWTINLTTSFSSANYSVWYTNGTTGSPTDRVPQVRALAAGTVQVNTWDISTGAADDPAATAINCVGGFGDQ